MARHHLPRSTERGASLPEYALLIAVFAVATIGGIDLLQGTASAAFREQAAEMSDPPAADVASSTPTTAAPTTAPPTTAPPTTTPPTTAPPTTTRPTTTTTTSTTSTTTTTIARATSATSSWGSATSARNGNSWNAAATLTVTDNLGRPVASASVTVLTETRVGSGSWREVGRTSGATSSSGTLGVSTTGLARTGQSAIGSLRYTVVSLTAAGLSSSAGATVTISTP